MELIITHEPRQVWRTIVGRFKSISIEVITTLFLGERLNERSCGLHGHMQAPSRVDQPTSYMIGCLALLTSITHPSHTIKGMLTYSGGVGYTIRISYNTPS